MKIAKFLYVCVCVCVRVYGQVRIEEICLSMFDQSIEVDSVKHF